ncbi:hypothetical protein INT45_002819 [Circinella minor]|uniref:Cytochrome P450 n=1 Tax=Circinella minor TaxID=1195481 RepID=A0A8H7VHW3_9FUNG|nr:hypothetical protein INT45_002819 [Circinella minor]
MDLTTITNQLSGYVKNINLNSQQQQKIGVVTAATLVSAYALYKQFSKEKDYGCPTVPYTDSVKGSEEEYRKDPRAFVEKWTEKLGPVYRVHIFGRMHTVVSGKYAREVFMNDDFNFVTATLKKFDVFALAGIFDSDTMNEVIRKTINQHLNPQLKEYTPRVVKNLAIGFNEILGDATEPKEIYHLYPLLNRMVTRASATIFVGEELCKDESILQVMQGITAKIGQYHPRVNPTWLTGFPSLMGIYFWYIGKFSTEIKNVRNTLKSALIPEIKKRKENAEKDPNWQRPTDMLQQLIDSDPSTPLNDTFYEKVLNFLLLLVFASIHTTTENGIIVLYRLLQKPEIFDDLLKEQQQVLAENGLDPQGPSEDVFTCDVLKKMPKLDSVVRESLRLRNQFYELPHTNIRNRNVVLSNGVSIPPDMDVLINVWHNHHEGEETDLGEFKPFRYVDTRYPASKVADNYLVFGEGKHACPGRWLAIQEIKTVVAMMVREYKLTAPEGVNYPMTGSGLPSGKVIIEKRTI